MTKIYTKLLFILFLIGYLPTSLIVQQRFGNFEGYYFNWITSTIIISALFTAVVSLFLFYVFVGRNRIFSYRSIVWWYIIPHLVTMLYVYLLGGTILSEFIFDDNLIPLFYSIVSLSEIVFGIIPIFYYIEEIKNNQLVYYKKALKQQATLPRPTKYGLILFIFSPAILLFAVLVAIIAGWIQ